MSENQARNILPQTGERALIAGQTGGGKTAFAVWMLLRLEQSPCIIYDTKGESKFLALPDVVVCTTQDELDDAYHNQGVDYIIMQPDVLTCSNPDALDAMLYHHYMNYPQSVAYLDELYMYHKSGRHGPGLVGLYTRGRSRAITTIAATQRPAWISGFAITEAQRYYAFYLESETDKKKLKPALVELPDPPKYGFYYWESGEKIPTKYGPVKLAKGLDTGYIDQISQVQQEAAQSGEPDEPVSGASKRRGATFF